MFENFKAIFMNELEQQVCEKPITEPTDCFKLPIEYLDNSVVHTLSPVVASDLEMDSAIYNVFLKPQTEFDNTIVKRIQTSYTSDVEYLQETQNLIKSYYINTDSAKNQLLKHADDINTDQHTDQHTDQQNADSDATEMRNIWNDIYVKDGFHERHGFIDIKQLKTINKMETFMGYWTIMNLVSPVFSILLPFMFLLAPFIILRIRQVPINFSTYIDLLKDLAKSHAIGKTLTSMENFSINNALYVLFTMGLYGLQMYQNCCHCKRFYNNISTVNNNLIFLKKYVNMSIENMEKHVLLSKSYKSYSKFTGELKEKLIILYEMKEHLEDVQPFETGVINMFKKCFEVGYLLKTYYFLHDSVEFRDALGYAIGFNSYRSGLCNIAEQMKMGIVNSCNLFEYANSESDADSKSIDSESDADSKKSDAKNFHDKCSEKSDADSKNTRFVGQVYPPHAGQETVSNTVSLKKNMVITGPNASGKTTQLKTTAINVILTQQFGVGYYQTGQLRPYTYIHSYLNIPDTSGRDSLFQAEARRCKEILDIINESKNDSDSNARHFCIFDELFSGTNADEATGASYGFLKYLQSYTNVDFILTTHFVGLCKKIKENKMLRIANYKMDAELVGEKDIKFSYKLVPGISRIKAARLILIQMGFPDEIVEAV